MLEIMNLKYNKPKFEYDFLIDRTTPLGNPYFMNGEKNRNIVCDRYEEWFNKRLNSYDESFWQYLNQIITAYKNSNQVRLFCWCSPKRCHGETIKKFLEKIK